MTIQTFLASTAGTPAAELRQALTRALANQRPVAGRGYARFYRRVLAELSVGPHASRDHITAPPVSAGVLEQPVRGAAQEPWPSATVLQ